MALLALRVTTFGFKSSGGRHLEGDLETAFGRVFGQGKDDIINGPGVFRSVMLSLVSLDWHDLSVDGFFLAS